MRRPGTPGSRRRVPPAGVARVRVAGGEVGRVVVGVRPVAAQVGGGVGQAGRRPRSRSRWRRRSRRSPYAGGGVAVGAAGQRGRGGDQRDLAAGARTSRSSRSRRGSAAAVVPPAPARLLDQVVPAGRDAPGQRGDLVRRCRSAEAYCTDQPVRSTAAERRVAQLDEVVGERGAGVAAAAVHLADRDVRRGGRGGWPGDGEDADPEQDRCGERDDARRDWTHRPLLAGTGRPRHEPAVKMSGGATAPGRSPG